MNIRMKSILGIVSGALCLAMTPQSVASDEHNNRGVISQFYQAGQTWGNIDPSALKSLMGDNVSIITSDNQSINLRLIEVVPGRKDPNRPEFLPRKQSAIAVFSASNADAEWLAKSGGQAVDAFHHALGAGKVFLTAIPKKDGGYSIEVILD
jgi:hypothetical protein